ncbi:MAG: Histidine phosphatase family protein [Pseudomonas fragi]
MFSLTAAGGISIVTLSLGLTGINRALLRRGLVRYRNALVVIVASVLATALALALLAPAAAPDLAQPSHADRVLLLTDSWAKGDVIAVVRHGERCDRSSAQCLGPADGVTVRGEATVQALGADFDQLGLTNADIYSSLLTRARQTADAMFAHPVEAQDWLFNCRGSMLRDALKHKVPGHNLILVSHSECMDQLLMDMHLSTSTTFGYGASLFIKTNGANSDPQMLGYIEPKDWKSIVPVVSTSSRHGFEASQF